MRSAVISAATIATASAAILPRDLNNLACRWDLLQQRRTCVWENGEAGSFFMPAHYKNMTLEIQGASGGGVLDDDKNFDPSSRGIGLWFKATVNQGIPANTIFHVLAPVNGADATDVKPGTNTLHGHRIGGSGGYCTGSIGGLVSPYNRQGGQGGSAAVFATADKFAQLVIAGAGGAGAHHHLTGCANGALTSFVEPNQATDGRNGNAWDYGMAGSGGYDTAEGLPGWSQHPAGTKSVDAGAGKSHESFPVDPFGSMRIVSAGGQGAGARDVAVCLAGGGGGAGYHGGGGGGAITLMSATIPTCAGGGGSGSNLLNGTFQAFEIVDQFNQYYEHPKIILTYDI